jgi:hypothetical protein
LHFAVIEVYRDTSALILHLGVRARIASFMDGWEFRPFNVDGQAVASLVIRAVTWRILGLIRHASSHDQ